MALGPEQSVIRNFPVRGKVDRVTLGEVEPADLPRFPRDDPTFRFMSPDFARGFRKGKQARVLEELIYDRDAFVWGIHDDRRPHGLAWLTLDDLDNSFCYYGIMLYPEYRSRGVGSLVTEAVLHSAFTPGVLPADATNFAPTISGVGTLIHPENHVSQRMCERAGFVQIEGDEQCMGKELFLNYLCAEQTAFRNATILPA